jgi:hypothetical protein
MNRSLGQLGVVYHWCVTKGGARTKTLIAVLLRAMELRVYRLCHDTVKSFRNMGQASVRAITIRSSLIFTLVLV